MGCLLDDLRAFGISADQWTTAAQDEEEWRKTAEQGAERFMEWIAAEKIRAGLRHRTRREGPPKGYHKVSVLVQVCSPYIVD